jgi:transposase
MDAAMRFDTARVGAMPLVCSMFDKLGLSNAVDELAPYQGDVPLGTLVEVMVLNRLLQPKAMFKIGEWAENASVTDYFGLTAEQLNDDRLGRALERIAEHGDQIQMALVLTAINEFDLDVSQIHYDITSVELYGAYETNDDTKDEQPPSPRPAYGHTKSGRKNVKQIQQGLSVSADGGVPICQTPLDGNAAESGTHGDHLKKLDQTIAKGDFLYVADTKLDTKENLLNIAARKGKFLCGGAAQPHLKERFLKLRRKLCKIDYCSKSQRAWPLEKRDEYKAVECDEVVTGNVDGKEVRLKHRLIFVWSERKARDEAKTRDRHIAKIREEFDKVVLNLNKFSLKTEEAVVRRLEKARSKYHEGSVFEYELTKSRGKLRLTYHVDSAALSRLKQLEGMFILKTNLPKTNNPLTRVLEKYRDQTCVERRFGNMKGPLAVAPMFLKKPERMAGLLYILVWALMVSALLERGVRRSLNGKPMYGLYPENRPSPSPTCRAIFECFENLAIVIMKHRGEIHRRLADLTLTQREIVNLLGIPPASMKTYKRRCGM